MQSNDRYFRGPPQTPCLKFQAGGQPESFIHSILSNEQSGRHLHPAIPHGGKTMRGPIITPSVFRRHSNEPDYTLYLANGGGQH